jgi:hypothetical protein
VGDALLQQFAQHRDQLAFILTELADVFDLLGNKPRSSDLAGVTAKLREECFRILVMGEMKQGKSTLINAMLGENVLPMKGGVPCTAIPTRVRFGETRRAVCFRRGSLPPDPLDLESDPAALEEAVTIPDTSGSLDPEAVASAAAKHRYVRADVYWPIDLCRNGVEIEDSAGLNEAATGGAERERETWHQAKTADSVLLVWNCERVGSRTDIELLEKLIAQGVSPKFIFVAMNRFDDFRADPVARARMQARAHQLLGDHGVLKERIIFTVARDGLAARLSVNAAKLAESGLPELERLIAEFLMKERSAVKLLTSLEHAERAVDESLGDVQRRESGEPQRLIKEASEAMDRVRAGRQRAEAVRQQLDRKMKRLKERVKKDVVASMEVLGEELHEGLPDELDSVNITPSQAINSPSKSKERLVQRATEWAVEHIGAWETDTLGPLVSEQVDEFRDEIEEADAEIQTILKDAVMFLERLRHSDVSEPRSDANQCRSRVSSMAHRSNVASQSIGEFLDSATSGLSFSSGVAGASVAGGLLGGGLALFLAIPGIGWAIAAGAAIAALLRAAGAPDRLKNQTVAELQDVFRERLAELEERVLDAVEQRLNGLCRTVQGRVDALYEEITACEEQVAALQKKREKKAEEIRSLCKGLRSRVQQHAVTLKGIRRSVDPLQNPEQLAARVGEEVHRRTTESKAQTPDGSASVDPGVTLAMLEFKIKLGSDWARLEACMRHFIAKGVWKPEMQPKAAELWTWCKDTMKGREAEKQFAAFHTVSILAIAEGKPLPDPKQLREMWLDMAYRSSLMNVCLAYTGLDQAADHSTSAKETETVLDDFTADKPGTLGKGGARFCKGYERMWDKLNQSELRVGTIAIPSEHLDRPRGSA